MCELVLNARREVPSGGRSVGEHLESSLNEEWTASYLFFSFPFFSETRVLLGQLPQKEQGQNLYNPVLDIPSLLWFIRSRSPGAAYTPGKETPQDIEARITRPPWRLPAYGNVYVSGEV